jgi:hypothetical protein
MQWVGRRRTRSPSTPKSDRIRDDTTASCTPKHVAIPDTRTTQRIASRP